MIKTGAKQPKGQPARDADRKRAEQVLTYMHPDLLIAFASLHGAPKHVAQATVALLPFGSRAGLESLGLVTSAGTDAPGGRALALTPFAYEVMEAAAADAAAEDDQDDIADHIAHLEQVARELLPGTVDA
jgi:hypothetical protein